MELRGKEKIYAQNKTNRKVKDIRKRRWSYYYLVTVILVVMEGTPMY